jgi:hypothetical protein
MLRRMANTEAGVALIRVREDAERALRGLDSKVFSDVARWLDKELYRAIYGYPPHAGVRRGWATLELIALLRARADVYRARGRGVITNDDPQGYGFTYDAETGNEAIAQWCDNAASAAEKDTDLEHQQNWDELGPEWYQPWKQWQ